MGKYKSKKIETKESTFSILKNFFHNAKETENRFFETYDRLEELKKQEGGDQSQEYKELSLEFDKLDKKLKSIDKQKSEIKKHFLKIGSLVLGGALVITGTISGISYAIQSNRENKIMKALSMQGTKVEDFYKESPNDLKELSQSPEEVTQLALDTLKANLANHYGVSNKDDFEISYKTEIPDIQPSDTKQIYSISYKGKPVCEHISRSNVSSGDIITDVDTMPNKIRKAIDAIATAQGDPESSFKAYKALDASKDDKTLEEIEKQLPKYLPNAEQNLEDIGR